PGRRGLPNARSRRSSPRRDANGSAWHSSSKSVDHSRSRAAPIWARGSEPALLINLLHLAASHTVRDKSIKPSPEPNRFSVRYYYPRFSGFGRWMNGLLSGRNRARPIGPALFHPHQADPTDRDIIHLGITAGQNSIP